MSNVIKKEVLSASDLNMELSEKHVGMLTLLGPANAGKSSLLNKLVGHKVSIVSPKVQTTRRKVLGIKTTSEAQIVYVDTPGYFSRKYRGEMLSFLKKEMSEASIGVDLILNVLDVRECLKNKTYIRDSIINLKKLTDAASYEANQFTDKILWVLNKIDAIDTKLLLPLISSLSLEISDITGEPFKGEFYPVSAKNSSGLKELEKNIISRLPIGLQLFPADMVMDQSDEDFVSEIIREKAFMSLHQEIPYGLAVVCREMRDTNSFLEIFADIIVEKDSQKAIVLGAGGSMIQKIGTASRIELEKIYGVKVVLKLFVRVEENWTKSVSGLIKSGYGRSEL